MDDVAAKTTQLGLKPKRRKKSVRLENTRIKPGYDPDGTAQTETDQFGKCPVCGGH